MILWKNTISSSERWVGFEVMSLGEVEGKKPKREQKKKADSLFIY